MRAGFLITTENGPIRVDVTLAEFLRWGRREQKPIASIAEETGIETWVEMIHWAAERTGQTTLDLDDFAASIIDLERVNTEDPKATTKPRGNGKSSPSKS